MSKVIEKGIPLHLPPQMGMLDAERQRLESLYKELFAFDEATFEMNKDIFGQTAKAIYALHTKLNELKSKKASEGEILSDELKKKLISLRATANSLHSKAPKKGFFDQEKNYVAIYTLAEELKRIAAGLMCIFPTIWFNFL